MYVELLKIAYPLERLFYEKQCVIKNLTFGNLSMIKNTSLFFSLPALTNTERFKKAMQPILNVEVQTTK